MCLLAVRIPALLILPFLWGITVLHAICIKLKPLTVKYELGEQSKLFGVERVAVAPLSQKCLFL